MSEFSPALLERLHYVESQNDLLEAISLSKIPIGDSLPELDADHKDQLVAVTQPIAYPGCLKYSSPNRDFKNEYHEWVSNLWMLNDLFMFENFTNLLVKDGYLPLFHANTTPLIEDFLRWDSSLEIDGFQLPNKSKLYRYQNYTLNRALERSSGATTSDRLFFYGWGTGMGKSIACVAGAQELFNRDQIDLALVFTMSKMKVNLCRFFEKMTTLNAVVNEGKGIREERLKGYQDPDVQVYIMNFEKANFDADALFELVRGKRVLWVFDEVQKILTDDKKNLARKSLDKLILAAQSSTIWPMSASIIDGSPERYRDVFSLAQKTPILGTKKQFEDRYKASVSKFKVKTKYGGYFWIENINWDAQKLNEVRHLVCNQSQSIRKTDPEVRDNFKDLQTVVVPVQMSTEDRRLYDIVKKEADRVRKEQGNLMPFYRLLRFICNTPEALRHTEDEFGQLLALEHPKLATSSHSSKLEMFLDQVESIKEAGDKVVAFTQWTKCSLFLIEPHLKKRKIKYVAHHGGMKTQAAQKAQDDFKQNDDITLFLSSDAGAHGLSFQEARFVIHFETPYSYDLLMQRSDRINRADSYLEGLTSYVYVTDNSVEERVWEENDRRRLIAAATSGTRESLSTSETLSEDLNTPSSQNLVRLIFGED